MILQGANDAARDKLEMFEFKMRRWLTDLQVRSYSSHWWSQTTRGNLRTVNTAVF